jgi:hypothetical protein
MKYDNHGVAYTDSRELFDLLYQDPALDLGRFNVEDPAEYNSAVSKFFADMPTLGLYQFNDSDVNAFDQQLQSNWHMPVEYRDMDIAAWVLNQCNNNAELQRCGEELLLYQERDAFVLLRYMKYLVDTMRSHNVVWGVGRGSSVASFVLYKIGVHRINSLYYDLDPHEFLK